MKQYFDFFKTTMPDSRKVNFYLDCLDSSVFIDYNSTTGNQIELCRISLDGYGCCDEVLNSGFVHLVKLA